MVVNLGRSFYPAIRCTKNNFKYTNVFNLLRNGIMIFKMNKGIQIHRKKETFVYL